MLTLKDQLAEVVALMRQGQLTLDEALTQVRKEWITFALVNHRGNQCKVAIEMGVHRNSLCRWIGELGIDAHAIRLNRTQIKRPPQTVGGFHGSL